MNVLSEILVMYQFGIDRVTWINVQKAIDSVVVVVFISLVSVCWIFWQKIRNTQDFKQNLQRSCMMRLSSFQQIQIKSVFMLLP